MFLRDIRLGLRSLARDKPFSLTVTATIAICIAANAATFAIINSVLLRPLPVPEADRIVLMANRYPGAGVPDSFNSAVGDYYDRLRGVSALSEQAMFDTSGATVEIGGTPRRLDSMTATPSLFRLLQVPAALGRTFDEEEGEIGADDRVLLSYGLWQELYAGDPNVLGQDLRLSGEPHTIVGVMPRDFSFVDPDVRLWTPLAFQPEERNTHHNNNFFSIGRLAPGATPEQVRAQVDMINAANMDLMPEIKPLLIDAGFHTDVLPLRDMVIGNVAGTLYLLWGGAVFVLLIGALNIANLTLVRLTMRRKEVATRRALGAQGAQATRQLLVESVLTSLVGGALGIALAAGLLTALKSVGLEQLPRSAEIQIDSSVIAVGLGLAALVGLLTGLASLTQASSADLHQELRSGGRGGTTGRGVNRLRQSLVAAQIGFAFVLLLGAGLLSTSVRKLLEVDPGFRTEGVVTFSTRAPDAAYGTPESRALLARRALEAFRAVPGVAQAGVTTSIPFGNSRSDGVIFPEGYQRTPGESVISPRQMRVSPGYFETMEIELVKGRYFNATDEAGSLETIIVDEQLAERFWPDEDPIGKRMFQPQSTEDLLKTDENTSWLTVVGVVRSVRLNDLADTNQRVGAYYFPFEQRPQGFFTFAVRAAESGGAAALVPTLRDQMGRIDPELALFDVRLLTERAELTVSSKRTAMTLAVGFGAVALFLSAVGIYGLLAYHVTQRSREIGIRMALGSTAGNIIGLVVGEGLALAGAGLAAGVAGALALQRVIANEVYGVSALDPLVISAVASLLLAVVAAASALPARRAGRIDPVRAINQE